MSLYISAFYVVLTRELAMKQFIQNDRVIAFIISIFMSFFCTKVWAFGQNIGIQQTLPAKDTQYTKNRQHTDVNRGWPLVFIAAAVFYSCVFIAAHQVVHTLYRCYAGHIHPIGEACVVPAGLVKTTGVGNKKFTRRLARAGAA